MAFASWMFVVWFPVVIVAEEFAHILILDRIPTGRADPYSWISVLFFAALLSAAIELLVVRIFFKQKLLRPAVALIFAIDLCCVGAAAFVTAQYVLAHAPSARRQHASLLPRNSPKLTDLVTHDKNAK